MTSEACLDANVFVAALTPESKNDLCLNLIKKIQGKGIDLYEPSLIVSEITSALYRKIRINEFSLHELSRALDFFSEFPILLQWQDFIARKAAEYAYQLNFKTSYDAFYLAVAMSRDIPLITFDKEFIAKAKTLYKKIFSPDDFLTILYSS